jgi:hypothetical protein
MPPFFLSPNSEEGSRLSMPLCRLPPESHGLKINETLLNDGECFVVICNPKTRHLLGKPIIVEFLSVRFFPCSSKNLKWLYIVK